MTLFLVMLGAALGSPSRWALDRYVATWHKGDFPWGTILINVSGSLLLGVILGATTLTSESIGVVALAGTGFCGGFTTFSTFSFETIRLIEDGDHREAALNVAVSLAAGLAAALAGWYLAQLMWA